MSYNINEMRPAIVKAYENGNRSCISKKMCKDCGISETYFSTYMAEIKSLYEAVAEYCRLKNSPTFRADAADAGLAKIQELWQKFTTCAEADEFSHDLHISVHDVSNLVGFAQTFMNSANNSEGVEDFVSTKVWAINPIRKFQKYLEIDLGIRVAKVEVLSDAERDFLVAEASALNKIARCKEVIASVEANIVKMEAILAKSKSKELREYISAQLEGFKVELAAQQNELTDAKTKLADVYAGEIEEDADPDAQEHPDEAEPTEVETETEGESA